jgi:hypothetical protein
MAGLLARYPGREERVNMVTFGLGEGPMGLDTYRFQLVLDFEGEQAGILSAFLGLVHGIFAVDIDIDGCPLADGSPEGVYSEGNLAFKMVLEDQLGGGGFDLVV